MGYLMYIFSLTNMYTYNDTSILDNRLLGDHSNLNMKIKIRGKCIGLVAAQMMIEANSRMMNGMPCFLYIHTHKRAGVLACRRAGVRAWTKMNLSVE